jgi:hypothetical protein
MKVYEVEIIHEPTGKSMNFSFASDSEEDLVYQEILADLSIVVFDTGRTEDE